MKKSVRNQRVRCNYASSPVVLRKHGRRIFLRVESALSLHRIQQLLAGFGERNGFDPRHSGSIANTGKTITSGNQLEALRCSGAYSSSSSGLSGVSLSETISDCIV